MFACLVKWYYLAYHNYYVILSNEVPGSYHLAVTHSLQDLANRIFLRYDYTLGSVRPFFTTLLYAFTFKGFGCGAPTALTLGILVGSLLVPLYFFAVRALVNIPVAWAATAILLWMTNYVYQSIALTTILPGILFITGALLALIRYHRGGSAGYLYLSGAFLSLSVFCRYENALLLPAFVGYEILFDKRGSFSNKLFYALLCASSSLWILYCDFRLTGNVLNAIRRQTATALQYRHTLPCSWQAAFESTFSLMGKLLSPWLWWLAPAGMITMISRHRIKAVWFLAGALIPSFFITYKIKTGAIELLADYLLLVSLVGLPLALECVRAFSAKCVRQKIFVGAVLGAAAFFLIMSFHRSNGPLFYKTQWYYSPEAVRLTEDLRKIPKGEALYLDWGLFPAKVFVQDVLVYLKRDPQRYLYRGEGMPPPPEASYYLLISEEQIDSVSARDIVSIKDYSSIGLKGIALYQVNSLST